MFFLGTDTVSFVSGIQRSIDVIEKKISTPTTDTKRKDGEKNSGGKVKVGAV